MSNADGSVGLCPVGCRNHEDDLVFSVDLIKKSPLANPITPCIRPEPLEFSNVGAEVGMMPELWVDVSVEFIRDLFLTGLNDLSEVLLELFGFEDPVLNQRNCPFPFSRPGSPA